MSAESRIMCCCSFSAVLIWSRNALITIVLSSKSFSYSHCNSLYTFGVESSVKKNKTRSALWDKSLNYFALKPGSPIAGVSITRWGDCSVMFFLFSYIENFEFCSDSDIDWNRLF